MIERLRTKMLSDIRTDCQCHHPSDSESITSNEKIECDQGTSVEYSGEIPNWTSTTYSVHRLQQFLTSWCAVITISGSDLKFGFPEVGFIFNVTQTQVTPITKAFGSGEVTNSVISEDDMGSGMSGTSDIDILVTGTVESDVEVEKTPDNVLVPKDNLRAGQIRPRAFVFIVTLYTALAILLSFVCFV